MSIMASWHASGRRRRSVKFHGQEILNLPVESSTRSAGAKMSMIFQDPNLAAQPLPLGSHNETEVLVQHSGMSEGEPRSMLSTSWSGCRSRAPSTSQPVPARVSPAVLRHRVIDAIPLCYAARTRDRRQPDHGAGRHGPGARSGALVELHAIVAWQGGAHHP